METGDLPHPLFAPEIHGFGTTADLDIKKLMEDATARWLRPNEVHAILSNYMLFKIQPQPVHLPTSGTVLLFDRKMLRNFRKDGHNWRKKKDGKTVQEAHEKLKIGNEERIHVYYARNEDDPSFYRRCYWLLDRELERIVLVHYRQISEEVANQLPCLPVEPTEAFHAVNCPATPLNSGSGSQSEMSGTAIVSEELDSVEHYTTNDGPSISPTTRVLKPQTRKVGLDELDKLGWGDIMEQPAQIDLSSSSNGCHSSPSQSMEYQIKDSSNEASKGPLPEEVHLFVHSFSSPKKQRNFSFQDEVRSAISKSSNRNSKQADNRMSILGGNGTFPDNFQHTQVNLNSWNYISGNAPGLVDGPNMQFQSSVMDGTNTVQLKSKTSNQGQAFTISEISPTWAYTGEETKVIITGCFNESNKQLASSDIYCVFGSKFFLAEPIQAGVYRVLALLHEPGFVDFHMTIDGQKPISQSINFESRDNLRTPSHSAVASPSIDSSMPKSHELDALKRLAHLLFSTTNCLSILSSRISPIYMKEAKRFASLSSSTLENDWMNYLSHKDTEFVSSANHYLIELLLKSKFQEWLLLKLAEGCRKLPRDSHGHGAIHLCAILDYAWAVRLFAASGFSLDFRDACGWTGLHWAAYYGRERMVAALLSAGANPSLVTDPTPAFPGGCIAADLASMQGFEGLGAYLAEKGLQAHFEAMTLSGNASSPNRQTSTDLLTIASENTDNFSEQELCLKDSLTAYRNAADAADRIQSAFRERSHKQQMKAAQLEKSEDEAAGIVAALKIQKAYRNYNRRKLMKAAARIQGVFRTWQARRSFLNLRRQVIKIQAVFRGHQMRKQYQKFCWSVGILEKAVLRWRLKRKGLRGLQTELDKPSGMIEEENCVEEDFYRVSREQAEERVQRSVVRVQAMFRSYRAQQEYRRMKVAHSMAKLEYEFFDTQQL